MCFIPCLIHTCVCVCVRVRACMCVCINICMGRTNVHSHHTYVQVQVYKPSNDVYNDDPLHFYSQIQLHTCTCIQIDNQIKQY